MGDSTPICRCRVLYLGSAVPRQSKDGLQGIQEPLRSLYPSEGAVGAKGIDSWLSVWSNGILLENVDENRKQVTRFFPIESLHYCAAVRQVLIPERGNSNPEPKFLPLDSPFARAPKSQHPPIFAAILRRTTGIKVLECHVFICKREAAANALVRCCFHAYADNSYARQLETGSSGSVYGTLGKPSSNNVEQSVTMTHEGWRSRTGSTTTLNSVGRLQQHQHPHQQQQQPLNGSMNGIGEAFTVKNMYASSADLDVVDDGDGSIYNGDNENHKVWSSSQDRLDGIGMEGPYEIYSGDVSTLGRTPRARQISAPIPVPPPPKEDPKKRKDKKLKNGGSQSLSGTLIRPKPVHANMMVRNQQPVGNPMMYGPIPQSRQFHTFSHRNYPNVGPGMHHPVHGHPHHPGMIMPVQMHHQVPVMIAPQYATLQAPRSNKKKKKDKLNGIPIGMPVPTPLFAYPPPQSVMPSSSSIEPRPLAMSNRKLAQSAAAGLDDSGNSGAESPGGTGIYRRKGHLNERAFSYSIRQEHRSRSHGSLASLQFNPPDLKKEREIAQMVAALDLNESTTMHRRTSNGMVHPSQMVPVNGTFGKQRR